MTDSASEVGYTVFGTGPCKVLALHGWFGDERFLAPLQGLLDPLRSTWASVAYRGYGASRHLKGAYTMEEISRDARGIADQLGWDSYNLVGHSMGGKAALRIYHDAPERVQRIIGIAPVGPAAVPFESAVRRLFEGAIADQANRFAIVDRSTGNLRPKNWVQGLVDRSVSTSDPDAFGGYFRAWADTEVPLPSGAATAVHALVGRHDPSITESAVRATLSKAFPALQVHVVESAGHYPLDEAPIDTSSLLQRLLCVETESQPRSQRK